MCDEEGNLAAEFLCQVKFVHGLYYSPEYINFKYGLAQGFPGWPTLKIIKLTGSATYHINMGQRPVKELKVHTCLLDVSIQHCDLSGVLYTYLGVQPLTSLITQPFWSAYLAFELYRTLTFNDGYFSQKAFMWCLAGLILAGTFPAQWLLHVYPRIFRATVRVEI